VSWPTCTRPASDLPAADRRPAGHQRRRRGDRARRRHAHRGLLPDGARPCRRPRRRRRQRARIAEATAREEGKPEAALPRIIEGRVNGYFKENVLLEQAFAKDQKKSVAQVLKEAGAEATGFARFRVGN
jgi:hypothetical protein